jgi:hypothetical protein
MNLQVWLNHSVMGWKASKEETWWHWSQVSPAVDAMFAEQADTTFAETYDFGPRLRMMAAWRNMWFIQQISRIGCPMACLWHRVPW